jgi:hypothetical protein
LEGTQPTPHDASHQQPTDATRERELALVAAAIREVEKARKELALARRIAWLVASPAVLGGMLLIFVVVAWGFLDLVEASGTTSAALVVAALLVLVPAVLAALRRTTAAEHAQQVFEQVEVLLDRSVTAAEARSALR